MSDTLTDEELIESTRRFMGLSGLLIISCGIWGSIVRIICLVLTLKP